jgi:hypothetical protein
MSHEYYHGGCCGRRTGREHAPGLIRQPPAILWTGRRVLIRVVQPAFMGSDMGIALSIGALAGVAAAVFGFGLQTRNVMRMKALSKEIQAQVGGPTPEQAAQAQAIGARFRSAGRWMACLLGIAVLCMAVARYV